MPPKRTQFSSCDECRRSRVACDALSRRSDLEDQSAPCTRCQNRHHSCTFKWMQDAKAKSPPVKRRGRQQSGTERPRLVPRLPDGTEVKPKLPPVKWKGKRPERLDWADANGVFAEDALAESLGWPTTSKSKPKSRATTSSASTVVTSSNADSTVIASSNADLLSELDSQWLPALYKEGFEAVFSSWMGSYSNPFLFGQESLTEKYVSISDHCCQLDRWMAESSNDGQANDFGPQDSERDRQIQRSLQSTIEAYSSRWLPLTTRTASHLDSHLNLVQALWRHARRDMLKVINRPSYRSMISLFLFALTPIPAGISEEEEADGISGQSCVHAALQQIQTLRARQRNLQFSGSKVSPSSMKVQALCATPESTIGTPGFINAESTAYWTALTFDTSASLTLNCRSLLSSGLFGFEAELPWRLVRTTSKMFDETARSWGPGPFETTDERANQIVAAGASWKLLGWKLTAIFKEALRDGHNEPEVRKAFAAVIDSIKQFNTIYRPRLDACQKRMPFLGQKTKLRYYSLMLHYHLSILMFVDIMEVTNRYDLLADCAEESAEAESSVMNTLAFGLHNTYTLTPQPESASDHPTPNSIGGSEASGNITVPLVSIDPYSHHVVAGVALVRKAVDRDFGMGKIPKESYQALLSTLEQTLAHLPQSSKSVQAARTKFSSKVPDNALPQHQDPYVVWQAQFGEWYGSQ